MFDSIENDNRYVDMQNRALRYVSQFNWKNNREEMKRMISKMNSN